MRKICFTRKKHTIKNIRSQSLKAAICTGEKVAGFKDIQTGKFTEVMLIRDSKDMDVFLEKYDIFVAEVKTEW